MLARKNLYPALSTPLARLARPLGALVTGVLLAGAFVPHPWSFLAPLPLGALFFIVSRAANVKKAFSVGFWGGIGFFALHLLWLPISFSDLFGSIVVLPLLALPILLASFWGVTAALCRMTGRRYTLLALPFAWVVMEYLRSLGVFGFTWGTLGYAFLPTPIIQVADLGGIYLVSLLLAGSAAALAALLEHRWWPVLVMASLLSASTGYGLTRSITGEADLSVLLVQGSVNPLEKASGRTLDELELYGTLTRRGLAAATEPIDLVIWPEGASPLPVDDARVRVVLSQLDTPAIVGAPSYETGYQNSAYGFDGEITGRYSKIKLVPFGERFPLREELAFIYDPIFTAIGLPGLLSVVPGDSYRPLSAGMVLAGTYICYESTFPQVARQMVKDGSNLLVNISNDAWFGRTQGAEQHLQMGRVRAIETRRFIARAGNDGISAVIDPLGRVVQRFPRGQRDAFQADFGLSDTVTLYVLLGDWVVAVSAIALALVALASIRYLGKGSETG
jgi:apolipoprotein N-acyltransferase